MTQILCPLDGSPRSMAAVVDGLSRFAGKDAKVTLFCVQHEGFEEASEDLVEMFDEDEHDEVFPTKESAQRMLDDVAAKLAKVGIKAGTKVDKGNVRKRILKEAKKGKYDLVIMHRLDRSGLREKLKMSGTEYLCRNLPCSVLLVDD